MLLCKRLKELFIHTAYWQRDESNLQRTTRLNVLSEDLIRCIYDIMEII